MVTNLTFKLQLHLQIHTQITQNMYCCYGYHFLNLIVDYPLLLDETNKLNEEIIVPTNATHTDAQPSP